MSLFEKYNLELKTMLDKVHIVTSNDNNQILAQYLDLWNDSDEIKESLIPEIDLVLSEEINYAYIGAEVVGVADIKKELTELGQSDVGYSDLELPTEDFKELIMQWLSLLEKEGR